jgi:hypothetical protein
MLVGVLSKDVWDEDVLHLLPGPNYHICLPADLGSRWSIENGWVNALPQETFGTTVLLLQTAGTTGLPASTFEQWL